MGRLLEGRWLKDDQIAITKDGAFARAESVLRKKVARASTDFPPEAGRYRLYAAWNCPWAHRALLVRAFLGLEDALPVSFAAPKRTEEGWVFDPDQGYGDDLFHKSALHEVYTACDPSYTGRVTVPLLLDQREKRLVSNESADIARMLNDAFQDFAARPYDLYPEDLRPAIDAWNARIHANLNNGVYKAGFAESQDAYDHAVDAVFETLDAIEAQLSRTRYLAGDAPSEADLRLFPTLARFDVAYHTAFKCMKRRIQDYPALWRYARTLFALPGVAQTVRFDIYRRGYFSKSPKRNPLGIIPAAPDISWALDDA